MTDSANIGAFGVVAFASVLAFSTIGGLSCNSDQNGSSGWPDGDVAVRDVPETEPNDVPETEPMDAPDGFDRPNSCTGADEDYESFAGGMNTSVPRIPWKILGPDVGMSGSFTGSFEGIAQRSNDVQFDCPTTASRLGLVCSTDRVLRVQLDGSSYSGKLDVAVAMPLDRIDVPDSGTAVRVTYTMGQRFGGADAGGYGRFKRQLTMQVQSSDEYVLVVEQVRSNRGDVLDRTVASVNLSLPEDMADPQTAYCIYRGFCRTWRVEPLVVSADSTFTLDPGSTSNFQLGGEPYRFWHLATFRRPGKTGVRGWPKFGCADIVPPKSSYAFVRSAGEN